MGRERSYHVCQSCGWQSPGWLGRCPQCGGWGTFVEERIPTAPATRRASSPRDAPKAQPITAVSPDALVRFSSGIGELDRVLGGGIVPGSLLLIGGEPGIGKSTLLLQCCLALAREGKRVLYTSGEESVDQIRGRAARVGVLTPSLLLFSETSLPTILDQVAACAPDLLVLDSVQAATADGLDSPPGSIGQVREVAVRLLDLAKRGGVSVILIGHVTKEGTLAGPKALEHIVDTVISFEGDRHHAFRILRTVKNRFGSTEEIGVFEMTEKGLCEVPHPSGLFLSERPVGAPGSVVVATVEGSRALLVEVQALVSAVGGGGTPRRVISGVDGNRAALLLAVLEKRLGLTLGACDVYINVAGGVRLVETATDLALVAAVLSSAWGSAVDPSAVLWGEVGLAGEVRGVGFSEQRVREALRLGFSRCVLPRVAAEKIRLEGAQITLDGVRSVEALADCLFPRRETL